ncbi:MAG: alpha/beta fold hydrolase [Bacteroidia bacterium]|nr:MAG: alpha/beta fold hydrolase [Bacteroidia bacterium]
MYYREFGERGDQPLVILHGLFGMSDNWHSIARNIAEEGYHVLVPDQRNHGRSGHSNIHNYPAMVDDLLEFLDARELEQTCLLGHSMGGKTSMQFAVDYPERVQKLIVADMSPALSERGDIHSGIIDTLLQLDLSSFDGRQEVAGAMKERISNARLRHFLQKNLYWKDRGSLGWRVNLEAISENLNEVFKAVETAGPFEKPVLFIRGGRSDYVQDEDIALIEKLFPQAKIRTLPKASHWLHAEDPDGFTAEVLYFLSL